MGVGGDSMLRIGDFSTLSKISIHMLRNYDKLGLLTPAHVDGESGYRYYLERQLATANRIQALKAMGLGLKAVKEVLTAHRENDSLAGYFEAQAAHKREELEQLTRQIRQLDTTAAVLRGDGNILRYSIEIKEIPCRTVASVRERISAYDMQGDLWLMLSEELARQKIPQTAPAYSMAIYHDEGFVESNIDIEAQVSVARKGQDTERVKFKGVPATLAAVITYEGEYGQISEIGELIADWAKDNKYTFCGRHFDIYHVSPAAENDSRKMVTEVGFPIQKAK